MAKSVEELEAEIRSLDVLDRDRLLRDLVAELDGAVEQGVEAAWLEEAQRRYQELRSGAVTPVPVDAAISKARSRLKSGS